MSRDNKRPRHPLRVGESDDDISVLDSALDSGRNSGRNSVRNLSLSRKSSRTNSATTSRSSSRVRGRHINYDEESDDEDDFCDDTLNANEMDEETYQKIVNKALTESLIDYERSQQQQQQQQQQQDNIARLQDFSFDDDDENDHEEDNYDAGDDVDELDDVDSEDEEDEEEEEEEEDEKEENVSGTPLQDVMREDSNLPSAKTIAIDDRVLLRLKAAQKNPSRTSLQSIVDSSVTHYWEVQAKQYYSGGAVQNDMVKNVSVVSEPHIPGDIKKAFLFWVGVYPCAKGEVYIDNKTTNAIEKLLKSFFKHDVIVDFVDAVLFSADKKGTIKKTFNYKAMVNTFGKFNNLQVDLFSRLCKQVSEWRANSFCSTSYEFPVFIIAGKDMEKNAYENWKKANLVIESEQIYGIDECDFRAVICEVNLKESDRSDRRKVLFILGSDHPSAHLQNPELKQRFRWSCALGAAGLKLSAECHRQSGSGNEINVSEMFLDYVKELDAENKAIMEVRRDRLKGTLDFLGILKDVSTSSSPMMGNGALHLNNSYVYLRLAQFEEDEVFKNVKKFVKEFGKECTAKWFKNDSFVRALCRKKTSTNFLIRLKHVRDEVFKGDQGALASAMCNSFCAALANDKKSTNFRIRLEQVRDEVFKGDQGALASAMCNSFCAALANDKKSTNFRIRLEQVRDEVFKGDQGALVKAMCDSFCAALANDEKYTSFLGRLEQIRDEVCKGDQGALATACRDSLWIRYALANRDEAHITELKKGLQNSGEQQQGQQPKPEPRQPKFRRPEPRL